MDCGCQETQLRRLGVLCVCVCVGACVRACVRGSGEGGGDWWLLRDGEL
jgi:hypothetical protein